MAYDKKQFLDLLLEYRSDEAKKARRNVSTIAVVILAAWLLNLHLSNMNVFGMNVSQASEIPVLIVAFVLLVYWLGMFLLALYQDSEIQKERKLILGDEVEYLVKRREEIEKAKKDLGPSYWRQEYPDYTEVTASIEAYQIQQVRTMRAIIAVAWMRRLEFYVPMALAVLAVLALVEMFCNALNFTAG